VEAFLLLDEKRQKRVYLKDKNVLNAIFAITEAAMYIQQAVGRKLHGEVFFEKKWKWGVFYKKVENGGVFCKKSGPFLNAGCIMYSISIFYFTFYLFGGAYAMFGVAQW